MKLTKHAAALRDQLSAGETVVNNCQGACTLKLAGTRIRRAAVDELLNAELLAVQNPTSAGCEYVLRTT